MVKHARNSIDRRMCNNVLLIFISFTDLCTMYLEKLMKLNEFLVIADITIKMLSYTHLIRIRTNNNHLKILSWLKYKSFHVYGTLKIFHLFSRKKRWVCMNTYNGLNQHCIAITIIIIIVIGIAIFYYRAFMDKPCKMYSLMEQHCKYI